MYRVSAKNMPVVQQAFSLLNIEYLDVYATPNYVKIIGSTSELFLQVMFDVDTTVDSKDKTCEFRINRKLFLSMLSTGGFIISDKDDTVSIGFYTGTVMTKKITFSKQIVFAQKYVEQVKLLSQIDFRDCSTFSLNDYKQVIKAAKFLNTKVSITDGAVSVNGATLKLFMPYNGDLTMGINGSALSVLNAISSELKTVGFYVCSEYENIVAMLKKERVAVNDEVSKILDSKSKYITGIDFSNIFAFLKRIKITDDKVVCDFESKMVTLKFENTIINLPTLVKDERKAENAVAPKITLSLDLVRFIESVFKTNEPFVLYCKRNFTVLKQGGLYLVF